MTNRKSHTRFRLVRKSTTLGDFKGHYALCVLKHVRLSEPMHHEKLNEDRLHYQRRLHSAMTLDSGNIRFMRIFAVVLKVYVIFSDFMPTPVYSVCTHHRLFRYQVQLFCLLQLLSANSAAAGCKVRTSGDVASGLAKCDPQSI